MMAQAERGKDDGGQFESSATRYEWRSCVCMGLRYTKLPPAHSWCDPGDEAALSGKEPKRTGNAFAGEWGVCPAADKGSGENSGLCLSLVALGAGILPPA